ncbi:C6 transcription factor [Botrytis cinerea]
MAKETHDEAAMATKSKDGGNVSDQVQNGCRESKNSEFPACQSCRKKKAKCSRQQPCTQCEQINIECVYDDKKIRPGLRTGAVESLSQRVAALESMFLGQGLLLQPLLERALSLQSPILASTDDEDKSYNSGSLVNQVDNLKAVLSNASANCSEQTQIDTDLHSQHKAKRRRVDDPLSLLSTELRVVNSQRDNLEWTELPQQIF